jgi:RHS repeat-associated protein
MHVSKCRTLLILAFLLLCGGRAYAQTPTITSISPSSGPIGSSVAIAGTNFGGTQGTSVVALNGTNATVTSWSETGIVVIVPVGSTSGPFSVTVNSQPVNSSSFTVTALPSNWAGSDIGTVGLAGSATYSNGTFTVSGGGTLIGGTADSFHFAYQQWSGDGTIVARLVSVQGGGTYHLAGIMIRETLAVGATEASMDYSSVYGGYFELLDRTSTGGSTSSTQGNTGTSLPYWVKLVRAGSTFSGYISADGVNWTQLGTSQTISMATNVYIGLAVEGYSTSALATAAFDNVSVSSSTTPAPVISTVSATSGSIGSQVTITGSNFGTSQGSSVAAMNSLPLTINSWSSTSISTTIPTGATSGPLVVEVGPSMNVSNHVNFTVTSQPLPATWLDSDLGSVGLIGSATYSNGTYTVNGAGITINGSTDTFHFAYQTLSGDGTIVARIVSLSSVTYAGVMIRETLNSNSTNGFVGYQSTHSNLIFQYRTSTGGSTGQASTGGSLPYWVKLVRAGSTFTGYTSPDGVNWTQLGTSQTISMATNVYIGLGATSGSTTTLGAATFDNVSINSAATPAPVISSVTATTGAIGSQVTITGSNFGASQGNSLVVLNTLPMTVSSWSATSITITIPTGATSGPLEVLVGPSMNASNHVNFTVTSQPLPSTWLDGDVGSVGVVGSATYSNGTYTVNGAGVTINGSADTFHFAYQPLSGDGTIVARIVSLAGASYAGVMIRETLNSNSTNGFVGIQNTYSHLIYQYRTTTGGSTGQAEVNGSLPYWVKLVRAGGTFTAYISSDGVNWTQLGTSQTISMATNVYIGLGVTSGSTTTLGTTTFDNVSINSAATPAPVISSVTATTGAIGSQVTITGSNFGASQGSSVVLLNALPMTINSWSNTSITVTIASGAASGYLAVLVGPSMNASNPVYFTVTTQPLPSGWLDQDIGTVGTAGSAGYASGTFTVKGAGTTISGTADSFHFAYQSLSGDGTIVARLASLEGGGAYHFAGIMIRETLTAGSTEANVGYGYSSGGYYLFSFDDRASTGGSTANQPGPYTNLPYWLRLTRSGSTFTAYTSSDGVYWTPTGNSVTISMATNVYIGLAVDSNITSQLATATFDNVSVTAGTPYSWPDISGITPTYGGIGFSVTVNGSGFGATQGSSTVRFNGSPASSITSWSNSQIVAIVPSSASTGPVTVIANGIGSNQNVVFTLYNPIISSLLPPYGPVAGTIVIRGSGFGASQGGSQVQFNGLNGASNGMTWSDTSITAYVPNGATSGPVTVTVNGVTSNSQQFSVIEAATISGVSPTSGPMGTPVTITGTGFGSVQSDSAIDFLGVPSTVINSWSDTQIVAVVPPYTGTGPVSVTVAGITVGGPIFSLTRSTQLTDSLGNVSNYTAVVEGGEWKATAEAGSGCSSCSDRGTIYTTYDGSGNVLTRTDPLGITTTYTYDSSNDLLSQSTPLNGTTNATTSYTYNSLGEVLTVTDPLGNVTTNTYDSHGNLLTVTSPAPNSSTAASVTTFAYNSLGELTKITDPLSHVTTMTYTTAGLIATITDAQSNVTTYGYDTKGNRTSVTDALSHQTTFAYDAMNRLTTITYPDTTTSRFTYDIRGRRTSVTDQNGKTTSYAYDDADRLTSVTDAASHVTYYAYDTESNLTSITDANSNQTAFIYDAYGRVTQTNFPSSLSEYYQYDADNNLTSKTDRKSQTITYVYDALNRLTSKTYPDTTAVDYVYDLVGKIQQVNDPTGTYAFAYDNMGRPIGTTTSYSFLTSRNFTNAYTYDAASNRTGFTDPESGSTAYSYDTLNRLTSLAPPSAFGSGSFGFSYDALSRRTQMTRPNSVTTNYTYDNLSRLTSVLHQLSGSTIDGASYTLDSAGNRTAKTDQLAAVTSTYTYDAIYQLTQVTQANNTTESYSYDAAGNRTASLGVSSYTTNASNELTATSNASYTYDNNGNTLTKTVGSNTTSYSWDYENRLTSVTLPGSGGTVSFQYDPFARRIYKQSPTFTSIFAYDGDNLIETANSSGGVVSRYAHTQNIDEPLEEVRSSTTSYYEADGLDSVSSLTNTAGAVANTYTYDSFGNLTNSAGSVSSPFEYTGRELDSETGLYFYRARYYDPQVGRFLREDPLGLNSGQINFYSYVGNQPVDYFDPFGLKCITKIMLVTAYSDTTPVKDWNYVKKTGKGGGPGIVAVANTSPQPYPMGSNVVVSSNPDPFFNSSPTDPFNLPGYQGVVHDTGRGWDYPGHVAVPPDDWIDIWLPEPEAKQWGRKWRKVTICTPDTSCQPDLFKKLHFGANLF